jgi:hypothetical protein
VSYCNLVAFVANSFFVEKAIWRCWLLPKRGTGQLFGAMRCNRQSTPLRDGHTNLFHLSNFDLVINQLQNVDDVYLLRNEIFVINTKKHEFFKALLWLCVLCILLLHLLKWTFRISRLHCEKCGTKNVKSILNENNVEDVRTRWKKICSQQSWGWRKNMFTSQKTLIWKADAMA